MTYPTLETIGGRLSGAVERQLGSFFRVVGAADGMTQTPAAAWISTGEPHPFANLGVTDAGDPAGAREAIAGLSGVGLPTAIATLGAPSDEVDALMVASGYAKGEEEIAMALDLSALADAPLAEGYELVEVTAADAGAWTDAFAKGYETPPKISAVFGPAADHTEAGVRYFAARRGGEIASTAAVYLDGEIAGIYAVATKPAERRKGLGAAVTAAALRAAADEGYRVGALQSSPMGVNVYKGLGFEPCGGLWIYIRMPEGASAHH